MRLTLVDNLLVDNMFLLESDEERLRRSGLSPGLRERYSAEPNLGLLSLAAVAREHGHHTQIVWPMVELHRGRLDADASLYDRVAEQILASDPDVVGLTTMACSMLFTLRTAQQLKRRQPELPILVGGPHASILHRTLLEHYPQLDVVVRHEAEQTLPEVLRRLNSRRFDDVPGVTWRERGMVRCTAGAPTIEDLDALPFPAYDLFPLEVLPGRGIAVEAGRGCPFDCTFCSTSTFFGRRYRLKSPGVLVGELDRLHAEHGFTHFNLQHDLFTVDKRKVRAFCEAVAGRGYGWSCSARVDCVDASLLRAMADSGCSSIFFGIETGSPRMQRLTHKRLKLELVEPTLREVGALGMRATAAFIIGFPEEQPDDLEQTLELMRTCQEQEHVTAKVNMLAPEPGTALEEAAGDDLLYDGQLTSFNASLLMEGDEEIIRRDPGMFTPYYHYRSIVPRSRLLMIQRCYRLLMRLRPATLQYMLRFFEGRLSHFMEALARSCPDAQAQRAVGPATVMQMIRGRVGAGHHLLSLLQYELDTYFVRVPDSWVDQSHASSNGESPDPRTRRLSPRAVLFADLHDVTALVPRIAALPTTTETLDDATAGLRGPHVGLGDTAAHGQVALFAVEPLTFALLERCRGDVTLEELHRVHPDLAPSEEFFEQLVELGVLVPVGLGAERQREGERRRIERVAQ